MVRQENTGGEAEQPLRALALRYPEAAEGVACKGTALESSVFKARDKSFLFIGSAELKVKLRESLAEAARLATEEPGRYRVGSSGWVTVRFSPDEPLPLELLKRWTDESYRVVAARQLVAMLPQRDQPTAAEKVMRRRGQRNGPGP